MTTKKAIAWHFLALHKNVMTWQELKSQDRVLSKQGKTEERKQHRPSLDYWNGRVRKDFKLFMEYENYPIFLDLEGEYFYITKRDDAILFRESTLDGVYCWLWQWDADFDELDIHDAGEIPIEMTAFSEQLDETLYLIAKSELLRELSKVPAYKHDAEVDMSAITFRINRMLLQSIPKEVGNRIEGDVVYLDYKGLTLRYNAHEQKWEIAQHEKGLTQ